MSRLAMNLAAYSWSRGRSGRLWSEPAGSRSCFQLAGERAWYAGDGDVITAREVARGWQGAAGEAEAHVQRILERLPQREQEVLEAMATRRTGP